jgi:hypothetical protein
MRHHHHRLFHKRSKWALVQLIGETCLSCVDAAVPKVVQKWTIYWFKVLCLVFLVAVCIYYLSPLALQWYLYLEEI